MPTLTQLIKLRNELEDSISYLEFGNQLNSKIEKIKKIKEENISNYNEVIDIINQNFVSAQQCSSDAIEHLTNLVATINRDIDNTALQITNSADYQNKFNESHLGLDIYNNFAISDELDSILKIRISAPSDWHYPGLIIGARSKKWVDYMVGSDPLYLIGNSIEDLIEITKDYNAEYRRKLRLYQYNDSRFDSTLLETFGYIVSWNYFNYLKFNDIQTYLTKIWSYLKPGGIFLFSYNNCNLLESASTAELLDMTFCTESLIIDACKQLGFEIYKSENFKNSPELYPKVVSWLEIKKPGNLTTPKLTQVIGKFYPK